MTAATGGTTPPAGGGHDDDAGSAPLHAEHDVLRSGSIRYARARRFGPPVDESIATFPRAGTTRPVRCPQPDRPDDRLFGAAAGDLPDDEDCLRLSVVAPRSARPDARLPVLVWIHGGNYEIGAGDSPGTDPAALVHEQDLLVVRVTYRLGLLGYWGDGRPDRPANLGLLDQLSALRWVHANIAAFGGDPTNVTVGGQSAGADAVVHLLLASGGRGLFQRAIVQSPPLGLTTGRGAMVAAMRTAARSVSTTSPIGDVLEAHMRARNDAKPFGVPAGMPFAVQYGHHPVPPERDREAAWAAAGPGLDVLIGCTSREGALPGEAPEFRVMTVPLVGRVLRELTVRWATWRVYTRPTKRLARVLHRGGANVIGYRLSWGTRGHRLRAAHATDLPLLFPSQQAWGHSEMTMGVAWPHVVDDGRFVRETWAQFIRTGHADGSRNTAFLELSAHGSGRRTG